MMRPGKSTLAAVVALLLIANGCEGPFKKKKPAPPPSIPPTIEKQPKIEIPQPQPTPPPQPKTEPTTQTPVPQPKPQPKRKPTKKVVVPPAPAETTPPPSPAKPAPDTSINAPMTNQQADRERQQTAGLLGSAENNLANIHRSLNVDEQNMVSQIRNYIAQSRKAMSDGDLERAYNLANKANLLSSELMKQ